MSLRFLIFTHASAIALGAVCTLAYIRHIAGWRTQFEAHITAELAQVHAWMTAFGPVALPANGVPKPAAVDPAPAAGPPPPPTGQATP